MTNQDAREPPPASRPRRALRTSRALLQLALIAAIWVAAFFIAPGVNNKFLLGLVGTVIVVGSWEAFRWQRQERAGIRDRRRRRGLPEDPAKRSVAAAAGRRRATLQAVGSLLINAGILGAWWCVMIVVGRHLELRNGYTTFLALLGTMGLLALHAYRRRRRKEQEQHGERSAKRRPIVWRRSARGSERPSSPPLARRKGLHPARMPVKWAWKDVAALVLILAAVVIGALVLLASFASTPDTPWRP